MENMRRNSNGAFRSNRFREPYEAWGSFVLDGANDPTVFGGHVASVVRIANATPTIAFRVTLLDDMQGLGLGHLSEATGDPNVNITAMARGPNDAANDTQVYNVNVLETGISPAVASPAFETGKTIDVIVVESEIDGTEVGAAVDTAGIVVSFCIRGDRVSPGAK